MKTSLWNSSNDQPKATRSAMIELLNQQLADALDLGLQAKQAHWNVKGPAFIALHELFDEVAAKIGEAVDEIAERTVALGGIAEGTVQTIAGPRFRFRHHAAAISSGATTYQSLAIRGLRESCLWLDAWNRQARVASSWVFRYWTMRWFHAALKHWAPALTPAQRDDLARFARRHWFLPRFIHNRFLFPRSPAR